MVLNTLSIEFRRRRGRREKLSAKDKKELARAYKDDDCGIEELCGTFGITRATLYKHLPEGQRLLALEEVDPASDTDGA